MENFVEQSEKESDKEGSSTFSEDRDGLRSYLEKESLGHLDKIFPLYISLDYFKSITEDDLEHDFHVKDAKQRLELMRAVVKLRDEDSDNDEHEVCSIFCYRRNCNYNIILYQTYLLTICQNHGLKAFFIYFALERLMVNNA
jgi:hypothetical protein